MVEKIRLTKAQREWLEELCDRGPRRASVQYKPAMITEGHRLALRSHEAMGHAQFTITDAGRQWLKEHAK